MLAIPIAIEVSAMPTTDDVDHPRLVPVGGRVIAARCVEMGGVDANAGTPGAGATDGMARGGGAELVCAGGGTE